MMNDQKPELALVTGAGGFIGATIVAALRSSGYHVRALSRSEVPGADETCVGDIRDFPTALAASKGAALIVHAAGTFGAEAQSINVEGTRTIAQAALKARARFIHLSSLAAYDRATRTVIDEESPLKTDGDPYGHSKALGEAEVQACVSEGLAAIILRPGAVLGVHPTSWWGTCVPEQIRVGNFRLRHDGHDSLPVVHIDDLARAVLCLATHRIKAGRAFNLVDAHIRWIDYAERIAVALGANRPLAIPFAELSPGDYFTGVFLSDRIRVEAGYTYVDGPEKAMFDIARQWLRPS